MHEVSIGSVNTESVYLLLDIIYNRYYPYHEQCLLPNQANYETNHPLSGTATVPGDRQPGLAWLRAKERGENPGIDHWTSPEGRTWVETPPGDCERRVVRRCVHYKYKETEEGEKGSCYTTVSGTEPRLGS